MNLRQMSLVVLAVVYLVLPSAQAGIVILPNDYAGLQLWLKADAGVAYGVDNKVTAWADQSGQGNHVSAPAGKEPEYVASVAALGANPAVKFNNTSGTVVASEYLVGSAASTFDFNKGTVFLVYQDTRSRSMPIELSPVSGSDGYGIARPNTTSELFVHQYGAGGSRMQTNNVSGVDSNFHVLAVTHDKTQPSVQVLLDGTNKSATLSHTGTGAMADVAAITIGARSGGSPNFSWGFGGQLAEVVVYDRILTNDGTGNWATDELNAVGWHLQQKYGLTGSFVQPVPIPMNNLQLWMRADAVNGTVDGTPYGAVNPLPAAGAPIAEWKDISGNNRHASQIETSAQPVFQASSTMHFQPALHFDGTDVLNTAATDFDITNDMTYFIVLNPEKTEQKSVLGSVDTSNRFGIFFTGPTTPNQPARFHFGAGSGWLQAIHPDGEAYPTDVTTVLAGMREGTAQRAYLDGELIGSNTRSSVNVTESIFQIGGMLNGGVPYLEGQIAEVLIYNRALSPAEFDQVSAYLFHKYVPEPTSAVLLAIGALALLLRRRRA